MPAPNEIILYDIAKQLENAVSAALFADAGLSVRLHEADGVTPREMIGCKFTLGAQTGHMFKKPSGEWEYDQFEGTLEVYVRTTRSTDTEVGTVGLGSVHRERLAKVQSYVSRSRQSVQDNLLYHEIQRMDFASLNDDQGDPDYLESTVSYNVQISISQDAWPAT